MLAVGEEKGGLYELHLPTSLLGTISSDSYFHVSCHFQNKIDDVFWHTRLGHASYQTLSKIACIAPHISHSCLFVLCPLAKQHRLPFPLNLHKTSCSFELVHCDLWGPYKIQTNKGCKYFLTIVDDFSRVTWTFLMSTKYQVSSIFTNFPSLIKNQFQQNVKIVRTDNGTEFFNHTMNTFLGSHGIIHRSSGPKTPQQNGVLEKKT